jgi:hypothetical protein
MPPPAGVTESVVASMRINRCRYISTLAAFRRTLATECIMQAMRSVRPSAYAGFYQESPYSSVGGTPFGGAPGLAVRSFTTQVAQVAPGMPGLRAMRKGCNVVVRGC